MAWFWWLFGVIVVVMWAFALIGIIGRRHTMSGGKLAAWLILVLVFPIGGALIYFLVHGRTSSTEGAETLG
jgi:Phospholipase_D-nuclease N-terminal